MNPKLSKFLEENPNIGMIGLMWSLQWRFTLVVYGVFFLAMCLFAAVGSSMM